MPPIAAPFAGHTFRYQDVEFLPHQLFFQLSFLAKLQVTCPDLPLFQILSGYVKLHCRCWHVRSALWIQAVDVHTLSDHNNVTDEPSNGTVSRETVLEIEKCIQYRSSTWLIMVIVWTLESWLLTNATTSDHLALWESLSWGLCFHSSSMCAYVVDLCGTCWLPQIGRRVDSKGYGGFISTLADNLSFWLKCHKYPTSTDFWYCLCLYSGVVFWRIIKIQKVRMTKMQYVSWWHCILNWQNLSNMLGLTLN